MTQRRYGRIVFLSSRSALGNRGQFNYAAAKAGVQGMARTAAIELGPFGITVNAVAPGFIETSMTRAIVEKTGGSWDELAAAAAQQAAVRRIGQPDDIAAVIAFLASEESGFMTGQTLYVTGSPAV
jgi:3-oxoacyl-[acyl-carrier protein] reductase